MRDDYQITVCSECGAQLEWNDRYDVLTPLGPTKCPKECGYWNEERNSFNNVPGSETLAVEPAE